MNRKEIQKEWFGFLNYLKRYAWQLLIFNVLLLLVWSPWMTQVVPRADTEHLIHNPFSPGNWLAIGRQGGILTRHLFRIQWFNPLFSILSGYVLICIAGMLFGYVFYRASKIDSALYAAFGLLCFTCPMIAENFYFDMMIFDIAWAWGLCAASVAFSYYGILKKSLPACIAAMICMMWIFSTYQIFVVLYVVAAVVCFVFLYCRWTLRKQNPTAPYGRIVLGLVIMTVLAFLINILITNAFFMSSDYLNNQIAWKTSPVQQCLKQIKGHVWQVFRGKGVFHTPLYGVMAFSAVLLSCWQAFAKKARLGWLFVLAVAGIQLAPFLMSIYLGGAPVPRSQLAYPMVLACDVLILYILLAEFKVLRSGALVLAVILCWTQTQTTERLLYTDQVRAQEDAYLASAIQQQMYAVAGSSKPLAFVGVYQNRLNAACVRGDLIGTSVFNFNSDVLPHYVGSSCRSCELSSTIGFDFTVASNEQIHQARLLAQDMPCWPMAGSVADAGDYVVVKLSEDLWPQEFCKIGLTEVTNQFQIQIDTEGKLLRQLDEQSIRDEYLELRGWVLKNETNSQSVTPGIFLYDNAQNQFWLMKTHQVHRPDVASYFEMPIYEYSGFTAGVSLDALGKPLGDYQLYIGVEQDGIWHLSLWGKLKVPS